MDGFRYPIGHFSHEVEVSESQRHAWIEDMAQALRTFAGRSRASQRNSWTRRTRDSGWTVRQVVHHLPDSHMNSYVRGSR